MQNKLYLGLDLGTSGLKSILINDKHKVVWENIENYEFISLGNGKTEQDPKLWIKALDKTFNKISKEHKQRLASLSFSGQMHGSVFLDKNNNVIRNVLLWNDQRTKEEVKYLNKAFPPSKSLKKIGNLFLTGFTAPKVLWLKNHENKNFKKVHKILLPKDYLVHYLSGKYYSDYSDSIGTAYMNIKSKKWDKDIIDFLEISEENLPSIVDSNYVVGNMLTLISSRYGFRSDVKIVVGGGDNPVGAIGTNLIKEGQVSCSFGTSGVVYAPTKRLVIDPKGKTHSFISASKSYYLMGVTLSAASSVNWLSNKIFNDINYEKYFGKEMFKRSISNIIFTPYLNGERTPHFDSDVRSSLLNIGIENDYLDICKAVLEGIIFSLKDSLEIIELNNIKIKKIIIQGGITKNKYFNQMVADIFQKKVYLANVINAPAFGAAILAYSGFNNIEIESIKLPIISEDEYRPDKNKSKKYIFKYEKYKEAYLKTKI